MIEQSFVDAAGKPKRANDGCAAHLTRYDALGREIEKSCLDESGSPALSTDGWASKRMVWSVKGGPAKDPRGVAALRYRYDEAWTRVDETAFDEQGRPAPLPTSKR